MHKTKLFPAFGLIIMLACACGTGRILIQEVDDSAITTEIISLLVADPEINHLNIKVITDEGEVFLIGNVPDRATRRLAEEYARSIEKVWSVINYLEVGSMKEDRIKSDLAIQTSLLRELSLQRGTPFVVLALHVHNAEVYLIGRVDSLEERQTLLNVVYSQAGIVDVHEHLKLGSRFN